MTCQVFLNLERRSQSVARELFKPRYVIKCIKCIKQHSTASTELTTVPRRKRKHSRRPSCYEGCKPTDVRSCGLSWCWRHCFRSSSSNRFDLQITVVRRYTDTAACSPDVRLVSVKIMSDTSPHTKSTIPPMNICSPQIKSKITTCYSMVMWRWGRGIRTYGGGKGTMKVLSLLEGE